MAIQIILNFILAFIWIFLSGSYTLNNLLLGFILGLGFVYLFSRILPGRFYFIKKGIWSGPLLSIMREK